MENFKKLLATAKKLELKYVAAQNSSQSSAQRSEVEKALSLANLHPAVAGTNGQQINEELQNKLINQISPLLDAAGVPASSSVEIKINVKPGPSVSFTPLISPSNPKAAQTLSLSLLREFSRPMQDAISKAGLNVSAPLDPMNWLKINAAK